ncbi:hypothetical protein LCGC14_3154880, partial [marine sediment metagenome]
MARLGKLKPLDRAIQSRKPTLLAEADLVDEDFDIPDKWQLKIPPQDTGLPPSLITPEGEEVSFKDVTVSPEGVWMTQAGAQQAGLPQVIPEVISPEVFTTTDEELIFREYQRTGGAFDLVAWRMIGSPIRPTEEQQRLFSENLVRVFPAEDPAELMQLFDEEPDTFLDALREKGRTPEVLGLLRGIGLLDEDIDELFPDEEPEQDLDFAIDFLERARRTHEPREGIQQFDPELDKLWRGYYGEILDAVYALREGKVDEIKLRRALELL